jgi:Uma2 family endonuclease
LRPLRRAEYDQMVAQGSFEGEHVELLEGFIVRMTPQKPPHSSIVETLTEVFVLKFAGRAKVRCQLPFALSDVSEPEPDFAIVPLGDYANEHPATAYFLVEVAHTSMAQDRRKAALYARAGVPEYWLIDVDNQLLEVFTEPVGDAYTRVTPYRRGEAIAARAFPELALDVAAMFGA